MSFRRLEILDGHALSQFNVSATCKDNTLDLILGSNVTADVSLSEKATSSTHEALNIIVNLEHTLSTVSVERKVFNFFNYYRVFRGPI